MDSMRSLNSSLPNSTPLSTQNQPPEQLLQAFKSAALSVTNLYKSAASGQAEARQQGYQDALEDLLVFLDKENLGLMDGEGWKVRQWATERYSRGPLSTNMSDDEDENAEEETLASNSSLVRPQPHNQPSDPRAASPARKEHSPARPTHAANSQPQQSANFNPTMFTFSAAPPTGMSIEADMPSNDSTDNINSDATTSVRLSDAPIRLEAHSRGSRTPHRHGGRERNAQRSGNREVRLNASNKRKFPVPDFFDLSNLDNGHSRDTFGGGGSKRGRFV